MKNSKKLLFSLLFIFAISGFSFAQDNDSYHEKTGEVKGEKLADGSTLYGKEFSAPKTVITVKELTSDADKYNDKEIVVKGKVSDVCQEMGCWMVLSDGKKLIRVETGHEFFLPKDSYSYNAVVSGKFNIITISEKKARHFAEESKNPLIKPEDIKGPQKVYQILATGIKLNRKTTKK
jgi:hypothetical protein